MTATNHDGHKPWLHHCNTCTDR